MKPAFSLHSPETGSDYAIFVSAPEVTHSPGPWTAVLFMDGDDQFAAATQAYRTESSIHKLCPLLLVGVGYGASYRKPANRRGRDYTPTPHPDEPGSGGAAAFLRFLRETLWPELSGRYPINQDRRGIAGHSLGSLFVLYALWQPTPFFSHYLASAPSLWWDSRSILQLAAERHACQPQLNADLFLSVGSSDTASMTGDLTILEQQLREKPFTGLRLTNRRFEGRDHLNVLPDAFRAGLSALFKDL